MVRGAVTEPIHRPQSLPSPLNLSSLSLLSLNRFQPRSPLSIAHSQNHSQPRVSLPIAHNATQENTRIYGFKRESSENLTFGGDDGSDDA